jgi:undecaprenyl diphosphate synthase
MLNKQTPNHLGIILDGNRRWAKERGLPSFFGHKKGLEICKKVIKQAKDKGVKILTLFVFSTENWKRSKREVSFLMKLLMQQLKDYDNQKNRGNIKIKIIGQKEKIPKSLLKEMERVENDTKNNRGMVLNFALSYGGRAEIVQAIKNIVEKKIPLSQINENIIKENLSTSDVDLIIRTGKEQRISNFLIWQAAYSELYFCQKYWPDFTEKDLNLAFQDYAMRNRRFGK